jgi:hypothetical protein
LGLQTERWLDRSYKSGLITRAVYNKVAEAVVEQEDKAMQMLQRFQHPSPSDLIAQATAFHHLTPQDVEVLAANTKTRNLHTGEVPKLGGDMHEGFLVVKSGMYEHLIDHSGAKTGVKHPCQTLRLPNRALSICHPYWV